jgi:hypothetical protein
MLSRLGEKELPPLLLVGLFVMGFVSLGKLLS